MIDVTSSGFDMTDAACKNHNPEWWFTGHGQPQDTYHPQARIICGTCPIKTMCFEYAIQYVNLDGMWAGTTTEERRRYRREHRITGKAIK